MYNLGKLEETDLQYTRLDTHTYAYEYRAVHVVPGKETGTNSTLKANGRLTKGRAGNTVQCPTTNAAHHDEPLLWGFEYLTERTGLLLQNTVLKCSVNKFRSEEL